MKWRECSMYDAILHAADRVPIKNGDRPKGLEFDYACITFTDGTAIACRSEFSGPYSEVTPDIDAHDPVWQVYS